MVFVGFHASHEQLSPSVLLEAVRQAEEAGFDGAMCSDHLAPWGVAQGQSGNAWTWLGAALATTRFDLGVVTAPGQRYHPAVLAQAMGTLAEMFPGRFWAALGSGEAINEHVTGDPWPAKEDRETRLQESAVAMRALLRGDRVDHSGAVTIHEARMWSRPTVTPQLFAAAVGPATASWAAGWADGLITVGHDPEALSEVVAAYGSAGGAGPRMVQVHVALADSDEAGLAMARDQWKHATVPSEMMWDLEQPEEFDRLADPDDEDGLRRAVLMTPDTAAITGRIAELADVGFDRVYLHHIGTDQRSFIERAGRDILPALRDST